MRGLDVRALREGCELRGYLRGCVSAEVERATGSTLEEISNGAAAAQVAAEVDAAAEAAAAIRILAQEEEEEAWDDDELHVGQSAEAAYVRLLWSMSGLFVACVCECAVRVWELLSDDWAAPRHTYK